MKIGVVGSINVDLIYQLNRPLAQGETRFANSYDVLDGGKGANQAVMIQALHENTVFLGAVGPDTFGQKALKSLAEKNLHNDVIQVEGDTGLAVIQLLTGDNQIVVFPGANHLLKPEHIDHFLNQHPDLNTVVVQLESPIETVVYLLKEAHQRGIKTILNPAPAPERFDLEWLKWIDYLVPNEHEMVAIFKDKPFADILEEYPEKVLVTLGQDGVKFYQDTLKHIPAQTLEVIDTTGAGDSFVAGFTVALAQGKTLQEAVENGINVASLTCQRMGAQGAYKELLGRRS